ncbi:MAG: hypothetical protein BWY67_01246 [Bacteroidetes bacterium ADurb.Bin397]|nr:MAG: hypothetical protein BWY67_01246 [Bacteroidetes bacterium ADurb.Bin397]
MVSVDGFRQINRVKENGGRLTPGPEILISPVVNNWLLFVGGVVTIEPIPAVGSRQVICTIRSGQT